MWLIIEEEILYKNLSYYIGIVFCDLCLRDFIYCILFLVEFYGLYLLVGVGIEKKCVEYRLFYGIEVFFGLMVMFNWLDVVIF